MATKQETQKTFTIPLRREFQESAPLKRTPRAVRAVRAFLKKHCKVEDVRIGGKLNQALWARGVRNPPARVTVNVAVDGGVAKAELEGHSYVEAPKPEAKQQAPESFKDKVASQLGAAKAAKSAGGGTSEEDSSSQDSSQEQSSSQEGQSQEGSSPQQQESGKESSASSAEKPEKKDS